METEIQTKVNSMISSKHYRLKINNELSKKETEEKLKGICSDIGYSFIELNPIFLVINCNSKEVELDISKINIDIDSNYHEEWGDEYYGFDPYLSKLR